MANPRWRKIEDSNVRHVWMAECGCFHQAGLRKVFVAPSFYQDSGEPSCSACGRTYKFIKTMIRSKPRKKGGSK